MRFHARSRKIRRIKDGEICDELASKRNLIMPHNHKDTTMTLPTTVAASRASCKIIVKRREFATFFTAISTFLLLLLLPLASCQFSTRSSDNQESSKAQKLGQLPLDDLLAIGGTSLLAVPPVGRMLDHIVAPNVEPNTMRALQREVAGSLEREGLASEVLASSEEPSLKPVEQHEQIARSGDLVARNNRDFYRPSTAPANLMLPPTLIQVQAQQVPSPASDLFELERYKVINATNRQRSPESLRLNSSGNNALVPGAIAFVTDQPRASSSQIIYDKPSSLVPEVRRVQNASSTFFDDDSALSGGLRKLAASTESPQLAGAIERQQQQQNHPHLANGSFASSLSSGSSPAIDIRRQQRQLLKFQPEDARDPDSSLASSPSNQQNQKLQPNQQLVGKTAAPPGFSGCAFYDSNCKKLLLSGKLVHLPASLKLAPAADHTVSYSPSLGPDQQHLDFTFGETTEPSTGRQQQQQQLVRTPTSLANQQAAAAKRAQQILNAARVSPLNQPLPPWSEDERLAQSWPPAQSGDRDLARLLSPVNSVEFAPGLSRLQQQPVAVSGVAQLQASTSNKSILQQQNSSAISSSQQQLEKLIQRESPSSLGLRETGNANENAIFVSPNPVKIPVVSSTTNLQRNFAPFRPTPHSVSPVTTHLPPMFQQLQPVTGRRTNFTFFESNSSAGPFDSAILPYATVETGTAHNMSLNEFSKILEQLQALPIGGPKAPKRVVLKPHPAGALQDAAQQQQVPLLGPVALRRQRLQQLQSQVADQQLLLPRQPNADHSPVAGKFPISPISLGNSQSSFVNGDISVTSAKLSGPNYHQQQQLLATQASNQAPMKETSGGNRLSMPQVNTQLTRSLSSQQLQAAIGLAEQQQQQQPASTDFFQDRSIAEIMNDSGLQIDGNQVTFARLKECLVEANLLSLISQTGSSITIFLPTDSAFQRLIQQQQLLQQSGRSARLLADSSSSSSSSPSFPASSAHRFIPLVARRPSVSASQLVHPLTGSADALLPDQHRLTLDCGSPQMRNILLDHLSARLITPKQLQVDTAISSLAGHQLLLSSVPSKKIVVVDGQPVIAATRAQNGMVYVVNKFLNLTQQVPNIIQLIQAQPNLTTFLSYLTFSGLSDRIQRETGPLTILAPNNEAFEQLSSSSRQLINTDPSALLDVLRGHILEGAQYGKLISMRNQLKTFNPDQIIEARVIKPNFYLLDNQMTMMRFLGTAGNGVLNIIDRIIVPSWLRGEGGSSTGSSLPKSLEDRPFSAGEMNVREHSTGSSLQHANHLPVISGQPVRFEQPGARLGTPSDSFLLENTGHQATQTGSPFLRASSSTTNTNLTSSSNFESGLTKPATGAIRSLTRNIQLIEKLANMMQANKFVKFLLSSRVAEALKPDMNYVILVPTDQAIEKLPKQIIDMLERNPERLADLVNYHVLDTTFEYINTIPDGSTLNTLNEKDILFNWHRNNTVLTASGAVVMGGIQEDNIALLIVDRVLYPTPGDILQIVSKSPILSNFTSLLRNAGLERQLSLPGPYTLFAPSDFAFNQLEPRDYEFLQRNRETARRFLLRHLSQPAVFTSSIALSNVTLPTFRGNGAAAAAISQQPLPTMSISNSLGDDLTLRQRNDYFSVNDVNFSYADVAATNGVVHVIDGLL